MNQEYVPVHSPIVSTVNLHALNSVLKNMHQYPYIAWMRITSSKLPVKHTCNTYKEKLPIQGTMTGSQVLIDHRRPTSGM